MRLIDADEFEVYTCVNKSSDYVDGVQSMLEAIDSTPTVDAVEVVRCKDCEYSYDLIGRWRCSHGVCCGRAVPQNFYCPEGKERRINNGRFRIFN